ncbi:MAG: hypothetical protein E7396_00260 [Ruminococcaceae bacterium]|nr:hypothetical protein [Oscillospiraceae bacterium]
MKKNFFSNIKFRRPSIRTLIISIVLILVMAGLLYINAHPPIRHSIIRFFNPEYIPVAYELKVKDTASTHFNRVEDRVFLMSGEGLIQTDYKMNTKTFANQSGSKPQIDSQNDKYIQFFASSKTAFVGDIKDPKEIKLNNNVITATINKNGYYAIATEEKGYKALITVYNSKDEEIYKWHSADSYILDMSLSPDNKTLAASTLHFGEEGQKNMLTVFKFSEEKPVSSTEIDANFIAETKYISSSKILLVTSDNLIMLSPKGEIIWKTSFEGEKLIDYSINNNYVAVANLSSSALLGKTVVHIYNYSGEKTGEYDNSEDIIGIDSAGGKILVTNKKSIHIINRKGKEINNIKFAKDIKEGLLFGDSDYAAIVTGNVLHSVKID